MANVNRYKKVKDKDGDAYLCNINFLSANSEAEYSDTEECFEADVAGRYASNIEIDR